MQYKNSGSGRSTMDVDRVNMYKFPEIANTPWHHATLTSGDCILVPAGALIEFTYQWKYILIWKYYVLNYEGVWWILIILRLAVKNLLHVQIFNTYIQACTVNILITWLFIPWVQVTSIRCGPTVEACPTPSCSPLHWNSTRPTVRRPSPTKTKSKKRRTPRGRPWLTPDTCGSTWTATGCVSTNQSLSHPTIDGSFS